MKFDSTRVADNGSFIWPYSDPSAAMLKQFVPRPDSNEYVSMRDTRAFSNLNARYTELQLFVLDGRSHIVMVWLFSGSSYTNADTLATPGHYRVQYVYFSEPSSISGQYTITCFDSVATKLFSRAVLRTDYAVNACAGWNVITTRIVSDDGHTRHYRVTANDVSESKWFVAWSVPINPSKPVRLACVR